MNEMTSRGSIEELWCQVKHTLHQEGHAEENIANASREGDKERVYELGKILDDVRKNRQKLVGMALKKEGFNLSNNSSCPRCEEDLDSKTLTKNQNLTKSLNTSSIFKENMVDIKDLGLINGGVVASIGIQYLSDRFAPTYSKWVKIGGGVVLQALALTALKKKKTLSMVSAVAGADLLVRGIYEMLPTGVAVVAPAAKAVSVSANQVPVTQVGKGVITATNIPTRYARAGILSGAQAFSVPEHADLIRVD